MPTKRKTLPTRRNIVIEVVMPETSLIITPDASDIQNIDDKDFVVAEIGPFVDEVKVGDIVQLADDVKALPTRDGRDLHFICSADDVVGVIKLVVE